MVEADAEGAKGRGIQIGTGINYYEPGRHGRYTPSGLLKTVAAVPCDGRGFSIDARIRRTLLKNSGTPR